MALLSARRPLALVRLDRRTLLGVGLAALAASLVLVVTRPDPSVPVLVAGADLPAGVALGELPVGVRLVSSTEGLVQGDSLGELESWVLAVPLRAGEPLVASLLRPPVRLTAPDVMALALEESHAALGRIGPGDLVAVYVTWPGTGLEPPVTELLVEELYVVEVRAGGPGLGGRPTLELLVAVDRDLARSLAAALRGGELDLVRMGP